MNVGLQSFSNELLHRACLITKQAFIRNVITLKMNEMLH